MESQLLAATPGPEGLVQLCVEGDGRLDPTELADAVGRAAELCPDTRSRPEDGEWVDVGSVPPVVDVGLVDVGDLAAHPALSAALGAEPGRWSEVVLARHPGSGPGPATDPTTPTAPTVTVTFRAHHALMDGRGVVLWARTVLAVLRGEDPPPARDTRIDVDVVDRAPEPDRPAEPGWTGTDWSMPLPDAGPGETSGLVHHRRPIEGTHPGVVSRLVAGLADHRGEPVRVVVMVDLRRHDPDLASTANFVSGVPLDAAPGEDPVAVQTRMLTTLSAAQDLALRRAAPDPDATGDRPGFGDWDGGDARRFATMVVSHWGRVPRAALSTPEFAARTAYSLSGAPPTTPPVLEVVEVDDRSELTLAWHGPASAAAAVEDLLGTLADAVTAGLPGAAGGAPAAVLTGTPVPLPSGTVVDALDAAVAARPDAPAVVATPPGAGLSYAQLDARADRVSAELLGRGVARGDVVGILAGRDADTVAAVWGVLRAGAAYLPIDPAQPGPRVRHVLEDSGARVCLVGAGAAGADPTPFPAGLAAVPLADLPDPQGPVRPARGPAPEDLAYVIYTSGTTGRPKGVEIEHRALAHYIRWATREFGLGPHTRMPWLTSPSFDVSVTALFGPPVCGGAILPVAEDPTPEGLRTLLTAGGPTEITCTPSHLELIGRLGLSVAGVRCLVVIGEALRTPVAVRARETFGPQCRILNEYGPTEATVGVTVHEFDDRADAAGETVPIGVPQDNGTVHILTGSGSHAAVGEIGRLLLGGTQLARGYLGRGDLTRERFGRLVTGERVYDTGDLARLTPAGELEFHGRGDDQIKILGHRIEPAEIARVAEEHPGVSRAVVLARAPRPGAPEVLVGWARREPGADVDEDGLTAHLAAALPGYMVPTATVLLDDLPLTVNGKVDALALPDPFAGPRPGPPPGPTDEVADEVTAAVAAVWQRVLELPGQRPPDPEADFHGLGGNSLSLLLMIDTVAAEVAGDGGREAFAEHLDELVRAPTVARVAALARRVRDAPGPAPAPAGPA